MQSKILIMLIKGYEIFCFISVNRKVVECYIVPKNFFNFTNMAANNIHASVMVCCLCAFRATSDLELESHIDMAHADIFHAAQELDFQSTKLDYISSSELESSLFIQSAAQIPTSTPVQPSQLYNTPSSHNSTEVKKRGRKPLSKLTPTDSNIPTFEVKQRPKRGLKNMDQSLVNSSSGSSTNKSSTEKIPHKTPVVKSKVHSNVGKQSQSEDQRLNRKRLLAESEAYSQVEINKRKKDTVTHQQPLNDWLHKEEIFNYEAIKAKPKNDDNVRALQEAQSRAADLEIRLNTMTQTKDRIEKENLAIKQEMTELQQKSDLKFEELNNAKEHLIKMSDIFNTKNAQLSLFKLNEERLILENNKYQKEFKKMQETLIIQGEKFESIRSTLKDVLEKDNGFCQNTLGNLESISNDAQVCDTVNFLISDYVESKKSHQNDVEKTNNQYKSYNQKIINYKMTILDLVRKIKAQTEEFRSKEKQMKETEINKYQTENEAMKRKIKDLGDKLMKKDDKLKEMTKIKIKDNQKLLDTVQQLKQKESKLTKEVTSLKKKLLDVKPKVVVKTEADSAVTESQIVKDLKAKMAKKETEFYDSLKKYIANLDGMKEQVQAAYKEKDSTIATLNTQLKTNQTLLASVRRELDKKSAQLRKLNPDLIDDYFEPDCKTDSKPILDANGAIKEMHDQEVEEPTTSYNEAPIPLDQIANLSEETSTDLKDATCTLSKISPESGDIIEKYDDKMKKLEVVANKKPDVTKEIK